MSKKPNKYKRSDNRELETNLALVWQGIVVAVLLLIFVLAVVSSIT